MRSFELYGMNILMKYVKHQQYINIRVGLDGIRI